MPKHPVLPIPTSAGIGLRSAHIAEIAKTHPDAGWLEVHAENYMGQSAQSEILDCLRKRYPLSVHGVGLSLGSMAGMNKDHLQRLRKVCDRYEPALVSEHLAWSSADGVYLNDLLPIRYDDAALRVVSRNVDQVQETLGRQILVENLSAYVAFSDSTMDEAEFLAELVERTGCGLLLDVNNVEVSAHNLGFDAWNFIEKLPLSAVGEIHLAGHAVNQAGDDVILIDDHGSRVPHSVWRLYSRVIERAGRKPTLIEWDSAVPPLQILLGEAMWADLLASTVCFARRECPAAAPIALSPMPATTLMPALAAFSTVRIDTSHALQGRNHHAFA